MSAGNPWEEGSTADRAWENLSTQQSKPAEPGFVVGAVTQLKQEVHIPTGAEIGASLVHSVASALRTGQEDWNKIEPTAAPTTPPAEKKPLISEPIKEGVKLLGILAAAAIGNAVANAAEKSRNRKGKQQTGLVQYNGLNNDNDVIDAEATDVE